MAEEQTLVLIKPDGLVKSLTGNILSKLSETELRIVGAKIISVPRALAEEHYKHLKDKPFFEDLMRYIQGHYHTRRVLAMVYMGDNAIEKVRRIAGATNPEEADPISIRGKYGRITTSGVYENVIHASENNEEAAREIKLWFKPDELVERIYPTTKAKKEVEISDWK
jgi:nucleoside-diphosphate kinase